MLPKFWREFFIFMKKKVFLVLFLLALLFVANINLLYSAKWWDAYFTAGTTSLRQNTEYENTIADLIENAKYSVRISSYTWGTGNSNFVQAVNDAYNKGLTVKLVGNAGNEINPSFNSKIPVTLRSTKVGIQHNKIIIIDYGKSTAKLIMGSSNWTGAGFSSQYNNSLVITNTDIIKEYYTEFEEMFAGKFEGGPSGTTEFVVNNTRVSVNFSPEDEWLYSKFLPAIRNAKKSVLILSNNVTNFSAGGGSITDAFINAKNNGAVVEGIFDDDYYENSSQTKKIFNDLVKAGADVRLVYNPTNMTNRCHNKVLIIDGELVITGSANFTDAAQSTNDENQIHIYDPVLAREYLKYYRDIMRQSTPKVTKTTFEENKPTALKNVKASPQSEGILVQWDSSNASDFDRYHIYVSKIKISSANYLVNRPEISTITDKSVTSFLVTTYNSGDELVRGDYYYFAVTAADKHGNESLITEGQSNTENVIFKIITGAIPSASVEFKTGESQLINAKSKIKVKLSNDKFAATSIKQATISFGSVGNNFIFDTIQDTMQTWAVSVLPDNRSIVFSNRGDSVFLSPGTSLELSINVKNPPAEGYSANITVETLDALSQTIGGLNAGNLYIYHHQDVFVRTATDGRNSITIFDGSAALTKNNMIINFDLGSPSISVPRVYWNTDTLPRLFSDSNLLVTNASGSGIHWQAAIPVDAAIKHNSLIYFKICPGKAVLFWMCK